MPRLKAEIKRTPDDFQVQELLSPTVDGDGEHAWLWVEKTGANTEWVSRQLATAAGVASRDVGYAGLKDRHARTWQWFSVRAPRDFDWSAVAIEGVQILDLQRMRRKLRRGAHRGNRFHVVLRATDIDRARADIDDRLIEIRERGVPNYFGEQRFGRDGNNLQLASQWCEGRRLSRHKRSLAISTARARIFNDILEERVASGSWNRIVDGELANLDGSGSVFAVPVADSGLQKRCAEFDIHPTATLWGKGAPRCEGKLAELERDVAARHGRFAKALEENGVIASSRPLRLVVRDLGWQFGDGFLALDFELGKGGYATTVIDQIADLQ